jgi:hypothetical protein
VQIVCVQLSELQRQLYGHFLSSKLTRNLLTKNNQALPAITLLKKLCNHPLLIREASSSQVAGYEECLSYFPPDYGRARDGSRVETSGKLLVLQRLLHKVRSETDDRFVLVSNYTSMLDVFQTMAREFGWSFVRLDGSTSQKKRTQLVAQFNEKRSKADAIFLFLLSSKAGGCGLNLIGGNRLVLFDPDWNPANDKQAAARVWRDGQTKRVYIYRMLIAGSIEEFVYERQLSKEGLAGVASNEQVLTSALSTSELKDLFILHDDCGSHFHQKLKVSRAPTRARNRDGVLTRSARPPALACPRAVRALQGDARGARGRADGPVRAAARRAQGDGRARDVGAPPRLRHGRRRDDARGRLGPGLVHLLAARLGARRQRARRDRAAARGGRARQGAGGSGGGGGGGGGQGELGAPPRRRAQARRTRRALARRPQRPPPRAARGGAGGSAASGEASSLQARAHPRQHRRRRERRRLRRGRAERRRRDERGGRVVSAAERRRGRG